MKTSLSTLCYIEQNGCYLMLHRNKKELDINAGKWIGVGGHFKDCESPEECLIREVTEETGYTLLSYRFRGIVTFVYHTEEPVTEYMHLFTADQFTGESVPCDEGALQWVPKERVTELPLWEGDRVFLKLLAEDAPFFSLKLVYDAKDRLTDIILDGRPLPLPS